MQLWEEQESEAAREKFPTLHGSRGAEEIARKIAAAYQPEERKVLSLNLKTKQATAVIKTKEKKKVEQQQKATGPVVEVEEDLVEDGMEPWVDEQDLGYVPTKAKGKKKAQDKFALVYVPLTMAEMREMQAGKGGEEEEEVEQGGKGKMRIKVPGMV